MALTILQPPATGKTLEGRPGYKGMLRSKVPEMCAMGATFRWLIVRVLVLQEPLPQPGTASWKRFYLWPGRSGTCTQLTPASLAVIAALLMSCTNVACR